MRRIALLLLCLWAAGSGWADDRVRVVTTLPVLAHWVAHIAGDRAEIATLLPKAEGVAEYVPTVEDVKALARSRVLVRVGRGLEPWLDDLVRRARNGELLQADAAPVGERDGGDAQGYVWLDPERAAVVCARIARELEIADPFAGAYYQGRARTYVAGIRGAAQRARDAAAGLSVRRLTGGDPHWETLAQGLGLEWVVPPHPGGVPDPVSAAGARLVLVRPGVVGAALAVRAKSAGLQVLVLDPEFDPGAGGEYPDWYEKIANLVVTALGAASP